MIEVPNFSMILKMIEGKPEIWNRVKPIVNLALLISPGLALEGFGLKEYLEKKLVISDSFDLIMSGAKAIWNIFENKQQDPLDSPYKLHLVNALLVYSAYFDTLAQKNDPLWRKVKLSGEESYILTNSALTDNSLMGSDGMNILPGIGDEILLDFYTRLNTEFKRFAEGIEGVVGLRADWKEYPKMAVKHYRDEYDALRVGSPAFEAWSNGKSRELILRMLAQVLENIQKQNLEVRSNGKSYELIHEILVQILDAIQKQNIPMPPTSTELYLPPRTAMSNGRFLGREKEKEQLESALGKGNPIVLTGLGGIGKTELAAYFSYQYRHDNRGRVFWVTFSESFRNTVIHSMGSSLLKEHGEQEVYNRVMEQLRQCNPQDLLVIDNVESRGQRFVDPEDEAYKDLCSLPLNVILTTRFMGAGFIELSQLDNKSLNQIFKIHGAKMDQEEIDQLIRASEGHTMTIDLIARTLAESHGDVTPEMILDALNSSKYDDEDYPEVETDHDSAQLRITDHLCALFNVSCLADDAKTALRYSTLLPAEGLESKLFRHSMEKKHRDTIRDLVKRGWLQINKQLYTIHSVIRSVCIKELKPTLENCSMFLDSLWNQYDPRDYNYLRFSQLAEVFSLADILIDNTKDDLRVWAHHAGQLWRKVGKGQEALTHYRKAMERREERLCSDDLYLAEAYNSMGCAFADLGKHVEALEYHIKALHIFLLNSNSPMLDIAQAYNAVGCSYGNCDRHREAQQYKECAIKTAESMPIPDEEELARFYNNLGHTFGQLAMLLDIQGDTHGAMQKRKESLECSEKALNKRKRILPPNDPFLASSYNNAGLSRAYLGEYEKALEYHQEALKIQIDIYPYFHSDIAKTYANMGYSHGKLGHKKERLEYQKKAMKIFEKVLDSNNPDLATSYSNVGKAYEDLQEYDAALEYLHMALKIRERVLAPTHKDLYATYAALGKIYRTLNNDNEASKYEQKAQTVRVNM